MTDYDAQTTAESALDSVAEFGWGWLIVAAVVALLVAPVVFAVLGEVSARLDAKKMLRTLLAAHLVGLLVWAVSLINGQPDAEVHGLVCFGVGAGSYWLGPLVRGFVKKRIKEE